MEQVEGIDGRRKLEENLKRKRRRRKMRRTAEQKWAQRNLVEATMV